jgi:prepilin-type N-terminal cleavage/methylation domain-containing protein
LINDTTSSTVYQAKSSGGFTLLEVMASVVIIGVAMTVIMADRNESVRRVIVTDNMRTATILAQQKINEIALGLETGTSGDFEEHSGFSWSTEVVAADLLSEDSQPGSGEKFILTVTYPTGSGNAQVALSMHSWGGKQ